MAKIGDAPDFQNLVRKEREELVNKNESHTRLFTDCMNDLAGPGTGVVPEAADAKQTEKACERIANKFDT